MANPHSNPFRENSNLESVNLGIADSSDIFSDPSVQQRLNEGDAFLSSATAAGSGEFLSSGPPASAAPRSTQPADQSDTNAGGIGVSSMSARICGFLSVDYYRPYFNVTTNDVKSRLVASVMPWKVDFFAILDNQPDLYGPVWILTTLVFLVGATSNISLWLAFHGKDNESFESDFYLLTFAASVVYGCGIAMPVLAWAVLHYTGVQGLSLANLACIYGYSISVFLPASVLCVVPNSQFQWLVVVIAFGMSATFLLRNLWSELSDHVLPHLGGEGGTPEGRKKVMFMLAGLVGLHFIFALLMKMYFFGNTYDYTLPDVVTDLPTTAMPTTAAP